jgi:hypothetical protein
VQYEALVAQPEAVLRELCAFLGEEWHAGLLDHTILARERIRPDGHVEVRAPISVHSVGRWQAEMTSFEAAMADRIAGGLLLELGYGLADRQITGPREWLHYLVLGCKYTATRGMRTLLIALGLLTLNRGKRRR